MLATCSGWCPAALLLAAAVAEGGGPHGHERGARRLRRAGPARGARRARAGRGRGGAGRRARGRVGRGGASRRRPARRLRRRAGARARARRRRRAVRLLRRAAGGSRAPAAGRTALLAAPARRCPCWARAPELPLALAGALAAAARRARGRAAPRQRPRGALEIDGEGPPLGAPSPLAAWFPSARHDPARPLHRPGCGLCRRVAGAADGLAARGVAGAALRRGARARGLGRGARARRALRRRARRRRRRARQGHGQRRRASSSRSSPPRARAPRRRRRRRGGAFLGRARGAVRGRGRRGRGRLRVVRRAGEAEAYHFCGHIYTTDGCPHPTGLPRIDRRGLPLRARDGRPVDDLGRADRPRAAARRRGRRAAHRPRGPPAARRAAHAGVQRRPARVYGIRAQIDGAWYRCCDGRVRKLVDCCSPTATRINGDAR